MSETKSGEATTKDRNGSQEVESSAAPGGSGDTNASAGDKLVAPDTQSTLGMQDAPVMEDVTATSDAFAGCAEKASLAFKDGQGAIPSSDLPTKVGATGMTEKSRHRDNLKKETRKAEKSQRKPSQAKLKVERAGRKFLEDSGIAALASKADELERSDAKAVGLLHSSLAPLLSLNAAELVQKPGFREACKLQGVPFTKRTSKNPDVALLRLTFPKMERKNASRCARALAYARSKNIDAAGFEAFASENGGIDGCIKKAMAARPGSESPRNTTPSVAGDLVVTRAPDLKDGEHTMVVRVEGRKAVFLREGPT